MGIADGNYNTQCHRPDSAGSQAKPLCRLRTRSSRESSGDGRWDGRKEASRCRRKRAMQCDATRSQEEDERSGRNESSRPSPVARRLTFWAPSTLCKPGCRPGCPGSPPARIGCAPGRKAARAHWLNQGGAKGSKGMGATSGQAAPLPATGESLSHFISSSASPIPPLASKRDNSILHRPPRTPPRNNHGPISVCRETPPVLPALAFASQRTQDPATTGLDWIGHHPAAETASHLASIAAAASAAAAAAAVSSSQQPAASKQQQQQQQPGSTQSERQQHPQGLRTSLTLSRVKLPNSAALPSVGRCCCPSACSALPLYRSASAFSRRDRPARFPPSSDHLGGASPARKGTRACTSRKATRASNIVKRP